VVGRAEAGPAAELGLGGEGEGRLVHHRSRGFDLHQASGRGGGDDVAGVPGGLGHGRFSLVIKWPGSLLIALLSGKAVIDGFWRLLAKGRIDLHISWTGNYITVCLIRAILRIFELR